jgi:hypothetical protein
VNLTHQVRLDHLTKDIGGNIEELAVCDHAGVIDPDIDLSEALDREGRQMLDRVFVGDIELMNDHGRADGLALRREFLQRCT